MNNRVILELFSEIIEYVFLLFVVHLDLSLNRADIQVDRIAGFPFWRFPDLLDMSRVRNLDLLLPFLMALHHLRPAVIRVVNGKLAVRIHFINQDLFAALVIAVYLLDPACSRGDIAARDGAGTERGKRQSNKKR